jgi:hypothetical protein
MHIKKLSLGEIAVMRPTMPERKSNDRFVMNCNGSRSTDAQSCVCSKCAEGSVLANAVGRARLIVPAGGCVDDSSAANANCERRASVRRVVAKVGGHSDDQ